MSPSISLSISVCRLSTSSGLLADVARCSLPLALSLCAFFLQKKEKEKKQSDERFVGSTERPSESEDERETKKKKRDERFFVGPREGKKVQAGDE